MRSAAILVFVLCAAGCQQQGAGDNPPVTAGEATRIAEQAEASFSKGDVKLVMEQYAPGALMIDAASPNPSTDRKVQTGWGQNFVSMQPADFKVVDRHIQLLGPDAFISSGIETFTVAAGQARPTVSARFTDVFQRQKDGRWKIVNEHVSMPPTSAAPPAN